MTPEQLAKPNTERAHQMALLAWCNMCANFGILAAYDHKSYESQGYALNRYGKTTDPDYRKLSRLFAVNNNAGLGDPIRGARAKAEGVKAGVPDLFLPVSRNRPPNHGLFIEMKKPNVGRVSASQVDWHGFLFSEGYAIGVCYTWTEAVSCIIQYLGKGA